MRNLKITKILLSLILMLGLTTSGFAAGHGGKTGKGNYDGKVKIEQKINKDNQKKAHHKAVHKKEVKIVKVYKNDHHDKHYKHHKHYHYNHHDKDRVVYYSSNNDSDFALKCIGTGLCLAVLAAAING